MDCGGGRTRGGDILRSRAMWESHPPAPSLRGAFYATWQSHLLRHCEERSDVAISFFCFFLYKNLKMRSSRWKAPLRMTNERHPPRRKTAPLQGGELLYYSPIEGGFKGGVPFSFLLHHISLIPVFSG
jgi:hypothetical protein